MKKALIKICGVIAIFLSIFLFFTKTASGQELYYTIQNKLVYEYYTEQEINCITEAVYFEARGESLNGRKAVVEVILNRADNDNSFPNKVCDVIYQKYQFSYTLADRQIKNKNLFFKLKEEVKYHLFDIKILNLDQLRVIDKCSDHYDGSKSTAQWIKFMNNPQVIGNHIFYCRHI